MTAGVVLIWSIWSGRSLPWFIWVVVIVDMVVAAPPAVARYMGWLGLL